MGCVIPIIGLFYVGGLCVLGIGVRNARESKQAATWPTAPGTIVGLSLDETHGSKQQITYSIKIRYSYRVGGKDHEGSRLAFGYSGSGDRKSQDEILARLKEAKTIDVRYDPADPSRSCLSFGMHRSIQMMLAFGITWMAFLIGITLLLWLASRSDSVLLENLSIPS